MTVTNPAPVDPTERPQPSSADRQRNQRVRFVRVGTWLWEAPESADPDEIARETAGALRRDSRVLSVRMPELNEHWTKRLRFFPDAVRTDTNELVTGADAFWALQLSDCMTFEVRVPIKNQPTHDGHDDIPSDTYYVAWDGISIFVMWEQDGQDAPLSGGHVVADVLRDALDETGSYLYVQSCSPACKFMFIHRTMRIVADPDVEFFELSQVDGERPLRMTLPGCGGALDDVEYIAVMLNGAVQDFAEFKNLGRRLIDLEDTVRRDLGHVLHHFHAHAGLVAAGKSREALKARWSARSWRKEARSLVARIWLVMANIETLRRQWDEARVQLASEQEVMVLFDSDYASDAESVQALSLQPVAETVNQLASGLDNRMVVAATAWGAVAGGAAGGLAGLLGR